MRSLGQRSPVIAIGIGDSTVPILYSLFPFSLYQQTPRHSLLPASSPPHEHAAQSNRSRLLASRRSPCTESSESQPHEFDNSKSLIDHRDAHALAQLSIDPQSTQLQRVFRPRSELREPVPAQATLETRPRNAQLIPRRIFPSIQQEPDAALSADADCCPRRCTRDRISPED